jgi:hypothetical protein
VRCERHKGKDLSPFIKLPVAMPQAQQPANVIRVDLERLSSVLGCSVADLIGGLRTDRLGSVEGARVAQGDSASFSLRDASRLIEDEHEIRVTSALISVASRPNELDSDYLPRQLLQLGGATGLTQIEIVLRNLYRGGIDRAVRGCIVHITCFSLQNHFQIGVLLVSVIAVL